MISPVSGPTSDADDQPSFLATIGHELRNPLSCILAQAETLQDGLHGPVSPAQQAVLQLIQDDVRRTLALVSDLADLGRIEANTFTLNPAACSLAKIQQQALAQALPAAAARSVRLSSAPLAEDIQVVADPARLSQVVSELLSAVLLSSPVGCPAALSLKADSAGLLIQAGSGLPLEAFPPFIDGAADDEASAVVLRRLMSLKPLGFTLLRKLVQMLGGSFNARSSAAGAFCLSVHLPLPVTSGSTSLPAVAAAPPSGPPSAAAPLDRAPVILLADDQPTLLSVTTHYLESLGFEVHTARDGQEAIRQATALKPDLILMDVRMPVLDGPQAIRTLRASEDPVIRAVPIISVSGQSGPADKERCLTAGASSHLSKPFGVKQLDQAIRQFVTPPQ